MDVVFQGAARLCVTLSICVFLSQVFVDASFQCNVGSSRTRQPPEASADTDSTSRSRRLQKSPVNPRPVETRLPHTVAIACQQRKRRISKDSQAMQRKACKASAASSKSETLKFSATSKDPFKGPHSNYSSLCSNIGKGSLKGSERNPIPLYFGLCSTFCPPPVGSTSAPRAAS